MEALLCLVKGYLAAEERDGCALFDSTADVNLQNGVFFDKKP